MKLVAGQQSLLILQMTNHHIDCLAHTQKLHLTADSEETRPSRPLDDAAKMR